MLNLKTAKKQKYTVGITNTRGLFELILQTRWYYHKKAADKTRQSPLSAAANISS